MKHTYFHHILIVIVLLTVVLGPLLESTFQTILTEKIDRYPEETSVLITPVNEQTSTTERSAVAAREIIPPNSTQSPIRKYFTTQKIFWTFDDYRIESNYYPPHKGFGGLSEQIMSYGGYVGINCIFISKWIEAMYNNEIRNYSVIPEFSKYIPNLSQQITKNLAFFQQDHIEVESHGWDHTEDLNNATLSYAYTIINYTLWNWYNNYHIKPHLWLGHSTDGNYNISLALKHFSDTYWPVYAEDFLTANFSRFPHGVEPAVPYIGQFFDPCFGCDFGHPCENVTVAKRYFNRYSRGKELIGIRGHPAFLNGTDHTATENLTKWQQFIDWVYHNHTYININHTEAIGYKVDRNNFTVIQNTPENYTIDLSRCTFPHNVLFTNPDGNTGRTWTLRDAHGVTIGTVNQDVFLRLTSGATYFLTTSNHPPNIPSHPAPGNGTTNVQRNAHLNWAGGDPDGNLVTYDLYFGITNPPPKIISNQSSTSYTPGLMKNLTTYYWTIIAWDAHGASTQGPLWNFLTTQPSPGGSGGGQNTPSEPENTNPIAHASVGMPYQGYINTNILFDGSGSIDPDGTITTWEWVFGDHTNANGEIVTHTYVNTGTYTVTLTVTDNAGAKNTDTTSCVITQPNHPPTTPIITGPANGTTNTTYNFTAVSTDLDNDTIRYAFIWGDVTSWINSSMLLPSNTSFTSSHSWMIPGQYTIRVTTTDSYNASTESQFTITINAASTDITQPTTPGFEFVIALCAIAIIMVFWKRRRIIND